MVLVSCGTAFSLCICRETKHAKNFYKKYERTHIRKSHSTQVVILRLPRQTLRSLLLSKVQRILHAARAMKTSQQVYDEWENTPLRGKVLTWYYYNRVVARALMQNLGTELKRLDKLRASANNSTAPNPSPPHASIFAKKEKGKGALLKKLPPHTNKQKPHA